MTSRFHNLVENKRITVETQFKKELIKYQSNIYEEGVNRCIDGKLGNKLNKLFEKRQYEKNFTTHSTSNQD